MWRVPADHYAPLARAAIINLGLFALRALLTALRAPRRLHAQHAIRVIMPVVLFAINVSHLLFLLMPC